MSYVAIARKWRPQSFEDIAGQSHVTRTLGNAILHGRIHHAYLFSGARGVGKTTAARTLARCLNCLSQGPRPDPCGACACCQGIANGSSPDVIEIDGASNNSVDDVRDIRESVRYLPQQGRYKIYIVDEVHMLSRGAFNALLKTLEEPPPHVVFIFATTEPQKIPDTILSRVQRFDFRRIASNVVVDTLQRICEAEGVSMPTDALRLIARAGEGSMRDSQSLLDQVISFAGPSPTTEQVAEVLGLVDRGLLYTMLDGMLKGEPETCLEAIDRVHRHGYDLSEFTAEMLELLRNATLVGLSPGSRRFLDVPDDERHRLEALSQQIPPEVFVRSFQVMLDVHEHVARASRPRLVLEMAVARLSAIRPARPLDEVLQRLAGLEGRLRQMGAQASPREPRRTSRGASVPSNDEDDGEPPASPAPGPVEARQPPPTPSAPPATPAATLATSPPSPTPPDGTDASPPPAADPPRSEAEGLKRFLEELRVLSPGSGDAIRRDAVFLGRRGDALLVGMRTELALRQARRLAGDPRLGPLLDRHVPGCRRLLPSLLGSGGTTLREARDEAEQRRRQELAAQVPGHPAVRRLVELLGATIERVEPASTPLVSIPLEPLGDGPPMDEEEA